MEFTRVQIRSKSPKVHDAEILLDGVPIEQAIRGVRRFKLDLTAGDIIVGCVEFIVGEVDIDTHALVGGEIGLAGR